MKMSEVFRSRANMYAKAAQAAVVSNPELISPLLNRAAFLAEEADVLEMEERTSVLELVVTLKKAV